MSKVSDNEKYDVNGLIQGIDDNIPTPEEIEENLKDVPVEVLKQWKEERIQIAKELGIELR